MTPVSVPIPRIKISASPIPTSDSDLGVEVVGQAAQELALDGVLLREQREVVAQLVVAGDDGALAVLVELWAAGAAKDLHHIQDAQVHQGAALGVIDLSALLVNNEHI